MSETSGRAITVPSSVMFRTLKDEALLLNLDTEQYSGLDAMGVCFWNALTTTPTIDAAVTALSEEFDVEDGQLRADLQTFVQGLVDRGLLDVVDA
jgi:Coenzyme PQQ synthesis protein D (PqqD)